MRKDSSMAAAIAMESLWARAAWSRYFLYMSGILTLGLMGLNLAFRFQADTWTGNYQALLALNAVTWLATAIAFLSWSYKAHANLRLLRSAGIRHADAATLWWWLVPVAFLVMPFRVMFETVRGSLAPSDDAEWRRMRLAPSAVAWTVLFLGGTIVFQLGERLAYAATSDSALLTSLSVSIAGSAALAGAAIAAIVMVTRVTRAQETLLGCTRPTPEQEAVSSRERAQETRAEFETDANIAYMYCRQCGFGFDQPDMFCGHCGAARYPEHATSS